MLRFNINQKELLENEYEHSPPLPPVDHFKFDVDQQTSSSLFYITALAVIHYYRYNEKIKIKMAASDSVFSHPVFFSR